MIGLLLPLALGALGVTALPSHPSLPSVANSTNSSIAVPSTFQPFEFTIVFVEPQGGCAAQCSSNSGGLFLEASKPVVAAQAVATSTKSKASYPTSSTKSAEKPLFSQAGTTAQLSPGVHWNTDTTPATNVIPVPVGKGSQFYHGNTEPTQAGYFGFLTYFFTSPSVNLDHCAHVTEVVVSPSGFDITFGSDSSLDYALQHWSAEEGLILIVASNMCPGYKEGERCYLVVSGITYKGNHAIVKGEYCHDTNEIITKGETEWGWWTPRYNATAGASGSGPKSSSVRPSVTWSGGASTRTPSVVSTTVSSRRPAGTAGLNTGGSGPAGSLTTSSSRPTFTSGPGFNSTTPGTNSTIPGTNGTLSNEIVNSGFAHANSTCVPPVDSKYGLPTACWGDLFDEDLDDDLGYSPLEPYTQEFINWFAPDVDASAPSVSGPITRRGLHSYSEKLGKRGMLGDLWDGAVKFVKDPVGTLADAGKGLQKAVSISGSINKDLAFKLPDPEKAESRELRDKTTKQVTSPWGDSVLLKAFGNQEKTGGEEQGLHGFMNVFCVGCGVSGHANVAGRASWSPLGGIFQGEVEMNADVQFIFKLGIDAKMTYKKNFDNDLLRLGLPGLTYGVVTIGPWVEVKSKVALEANAEGRLLAGAEIGLTAAHVLIDFVNPTNSKKDGWEPYFKPVFEAEGELMLSAELALPVGIQCGLQIGPFSKTVGIIDEPSIKGVAQVAASVGLDASGSFAAGFKETNGCTGISTQLTWRNKLYIDILQLTQLMIFDTQDKKLAQGCIVLPGLPAEPTPPVTTPTDETPTVDPPVTDPSTETPTDPSTEPEPQQPGDGESTEPTNPSTEPEPEQPGNEESSTEPEQEQPENGEPTAEPSTEPEQGQQEGPFEEDQPSDEPFKARSLPASLIHRADANVIDRTASVNSTATSISYSPEAFPNIPYNDTEGYSYQLMTVSDGSIIFISCGNGALYGVSPDSGDNPACSEMWATYNDVLVADASQRLLHFYENTMNATGASRLRVAYEEDIPIGAQVVILAEMRGNDTDPTNDTDNDAFYIAIDEQMEPYYPVMCTYADGSAGKLFVVKDPEKGVELLQSADVQFSITGGVVEACYTIPIMMGSWGADYASYDSAIDPETDTLYFE
ncbi:hypothetical protein VTL71DRAFT_1702 [Oculimacula yallundae]|uniref:DUF7029 domain-containing protein n=1 Tax=Oculimacula yallundae TaxID=86028 RepID=A0ABR4CBG8_9HELO